MERPTIPRPRRLAFASGAAWLTALALAGSAGAAAGDLDTAWGNGGKMTVPGGPGNARFLAAVAQPDGKLVAAGSAEQSASSPRNEDLLVVRLLANGQPDPDFGSGGIVQVPIAAGTGNDTAFAVALGPGGTIYAAGTSAAGAGDSDFSVVRLTSTGGLDGGFSGDGKQTHSFGTASDSARALAVQGDGKVVLAGTSIGGTATGFIVARLDGSTGALDSAGFNAAGATPGVQEVDFTAGVDVPSGIALAGGQIVVSGTTSNSAPNPDFALTRLNSDGTLDTAGFGAGTGKVQSDLGMRETATALAQDSQGRLVVAGSQHNTGTGTIDFLVARYTAAGAPDGNWSGDGFEATPVLGPDGTRFALASGVVVESDGTVVATGRANACPQDGCAQFAAARYTDAGALDTSFGDGGTRLYDVGPGNDFGFAAAAGSVYLVGGGGTPPSGPDEARALKLTTSDKSADLELTKAASLRGGLFEYAPPGVRPVPGTDVFGVGQTYVYTILVINGGPADAEQVVVDDELPSNLVSVRGSVTVVEVNSEGRDRRQLPADLCRVNTDIQFIRCSFGDRELRFGRAFLISFKVRATDGPSAINTATVSSATPDPNADALDPDDRNNSDTHGATITGGTDSNIIKEPDAGGADGTAATPAVFGSEEGVPVQNVLRPMFQASAIDKALSKLARVEVAVLRKQKSKKRCVWLSSTKPKFKVRKKTSKARCDTAIWLPAKGTKRWTFRLKKRLPPGDYVLHSRAVNKGGVFETTFSKKDRNLKAFKVRKRR